MSKTAKATSSRPKIIRAAILSASLLAFVPLFGQIRPGDTVAASSVNSTAAVTSSALPQGSSIQRTAPTTQQSVPQTHARTRGS